MTWLIRVLVRTRGIRLLLPYLQALLTLSQGTVRGILTLVAAGIAADRAKLSSSHEPGPQGSHHSVATHGRDLNA